MAGTTAIGVFENEERAHQAIDKLRQAGFSEQQIGVLVRREGMEHPENVAVKSDLEAEKGAAAGAVTGGTVGGLLGLTVATVAIPGFGVVAAAGALAGALGGAAAGLASGGLLGALIGKGLSEEEIAHYESQFNEGRSLVVVESESRLGEAISIMGDAGAFESESKV